MGRGCTGRTRTGSCITRLPGGAAGAGPVRKRGPVRMQHEGLRRRRRSSAQEPGAPPHCHVRRRNAQCARISRPIRSHRAGPWKGCGRPRRLEGVGKSLQSEVQKEKVRLCQPIRGGGARCVCAPARALGPIPGENGQASGSPRTVRRRGRAPRRLGQSDGAAGRRRAATDARGEGEVWARPRPRIYKGEVWP